jgi:hypothetical protein
LLILVWFATPLPILVVPSLVFTTNLVWMVSLGFYFFLPCCVRFGHVWMEAFLAYCLSDKSIWVPSLQNRTSASVAWPRQIFEASIQITLFYINNPFLYKALFRSQIFPQIPLCKKKIPHHIKMSAHVWSTKCRWNKKLIAQFCCTLRDEYFEPN